MVRQMAWLYVSSAYFLKKFDPQLPETAMDTILASGKSELERTVYSTEGLELIRSV